MKKIYTLPNWKAYSFLFLLITFFTQAYLVSAQNPVDPLLDQVPGYLMKHLRMQSGVPLPATVITVDNWDNFDLGIDYGENNMATHPGIPAWFFAAYNINGTHHTENGTDWGINDPNWLDMAGDPVVAYDSAGNLYYLNMYGNQVTGAKIVRSTTNGQSWESPVIAAYGSDKCWLACDQTRGPFANYVYVCMSNNGTGYFSRSRDYGQSFENTFNFSPQTLPGMSVCVGPNNNIQGGSVIVVTNSGDSFESTYTFYRSTDGGATFSLMSAQQFAGYVGTDIDGRNSVEGMRTRPYPYIAADNTFGPNRGRLYCVYASNDPPGDGNKPDIWCRSSTNGGLTWSAAKRINDDLNPQTNHQWHPAIWCDKQTGRLYVQWMDSRDTPTHDSAFIYGAYSDNGGISFSANQRISNKKMKIDCPTCGGFGSPRYQGDYNGIVSNKKVAMAGWTDFRNGTFMSVTAYFPDFAMAINKTADSLSTPDDSTDIIVSIPGVKLYADTVLLSGSISPSPSQGSLSVSFPNGNSLVSFPGFRIVRVKVSGNVPLGYYDLTIVAQGPNGTPVHKRVATLKINSTEYITVYANAQPPGICPGSTSQLSANTFGGVGPYSYSWLPTTGLNNPAIQNPLASPATTTMYHVFSNDTGGHSAEDSVLVTLMSVPSTPGAIIGPDSICKDSTMVYSIPTVAGAISYSWTVPVGDSIISGQNTPSIEIKWNSSDGIISVIAGNTCGNSNPSVKSISAMMLPAVPGLVSGPDSVCQSSTTDYIIEEVAGATTYFWTVPEGSVITDGQGTRSIKVNWGQNTGDIRVTAANICGTSDPQLKSIQLYLLPEPAGEIAGKDTVCLNHSDIIYTVPAIPGANSYSWELPGSAYITNGDGTDSIHVNFGPDATSGQLSVQGLNSCGVGTGSSKYINIKTCAGISENEKTFLIKLLFNPSDKLLNVIITGMEKGLEIWLISMDGKALFQRSWENISPEFHDMINVSGYTQGIYLVKILNNDKVFFEKVILL
jgi:hypothetical protein